MADETTTTRVRERQRLKTFGEINDAQEWLFNAARDGAIDNKTADVLNTVTKGAVAIQKLRLDYSKLYLQAAVKKIDIPTNLLPEDTLK